MDICAQIRTERQAGKTRCSVADGCMTIGEAAGIFGLDQDVTIYRPIARSEADEIATHVLHADLAYGLDIMSRARAADLWRQFMALFDGQDVRFVTNVSSQLNSSNPATEATFDMGVLVLGTAKVGCLWVEDED
jgi:hypothetical protein